MEPPLALLLSIAGDIEASVPLRTVEIELGRRPFELGLVDLEDDPGLLDVAV